MKRFLSRFGGNYRQLFMRVLARLHCALLVSVLFAAAFEFLGGQGLTSLSPEYVYLRGLLFCIPASLSYYAGKKVPTLWLFVPVAVGISLFSWLLTGQPGGLIAGVILCFFRFHARLLEEEERTTSVFDAPHSAGILYFALCFVISALTGMSSWQKLSLISCAFYLLILLAFQGIQRVDNYLQLNRTIYSLPVKRILKTAGGAVAILVLLTALFVIPPAFGSSGGFRLYLPEVKYNPEDVVSDPLQMEQGLMEGANPVFEMLGERTETWFHIPPFVSYLFYALSTAAILALVLFGIYRIFRYFRASYTDSRDVVQYLHMEDRDAAEASAGKLLRKPSILDRSPNAVVRRIYRKRVLRGTPDTPKQWHSPAELEQSAGLADPALHQIYEKARYSPELCTPEDVKQLKSQK